MERPYQRVLCSIWSLDLELRESVKTITLRQSGRIQRQLDQLSSKFRELVNDQMSDIETRMR